MRELKVGTKLYPFPHTGDLDWGEDVYEWAEAVSQTLGGITNISLPEGGASGQILSKASDDDYDVAWINAPSGGGMPTTYTAALPLVLNGSEFELKGGNNADDLLVWDGNAWTYALKSSVGRTYTAGDGLNLTNESFSIPTDGIKELMLTDSIVSLAKLKTTNTGSAGQVLTQTDSGLTWATVESGTGMTGLMH